MAGPDLYGLEEQLAIVNIIIEFVNMHKLLHNILTGFILLTETLSNTRRVYVTYLSLKVVDQRLQLKARAFCSITSLCHHTGSSVCTLLPPDTASDPKVGRSRE